MSLAVEALAARGAGGRKHEFVHVSVHKRLKYVSFSGYRGRNHTLVHGRVYKRAFSATSIGSEVSVITVATDDAIKCVAATFGNRSVMFKNIRSLEEIKKTLLF